MDSLALIAIETLKLDLNDYFSGGQKHVDKEGEFFMKSDKDNSSRNYRYWLSCRWVEKVKKWAMIIGKNPSTGYSGTSDYSLTEIRNCLKKEGFDGFVMVNRNPIVATDLPKNKFKDASGAIKVKNVAIIDGLLECKPSALICAWGSEIHRKREIEETLPIMGLTSDKLKPIPIYVFGMNKNDVPKHPANRCKISLMDYDYPYHGEHSSKSFCSSCCSFFTRSVLACCSLVYASSYLFARPNKVAKYRFVKHTMNGCSHQKK